MTSIQRDPVGSKKVLRDPVGSNKVLRDPVGSNKVLRNPVGSNKVLRDPLDIDLDDSDRFQDPTVLDCNPSCNKSL